jgi:hypothetical protein
MKNDEGLRYGQHVAFRGMRGTVLSRPRDARGKYLIGCNDGVKRMILACELTPVPGPARLPHHLRKSDG